MSTQADRDSPWLTKGVAGIGFASLLSDAGHEIPTALLPSFLTSTLGAPAAALGIIEGVADGVAGVARLAGGGLADDPRRRRTTAVGGYTATAVLSSAIGAATAVWQVAALRVAAWAARGLRVPSRNALLADAVPETAYGRAYGFERAMDNVGAIVGPLLALALVRLLGTRTAIAVSVVPGVLAAVAIVYAVRHLPRAPHRHHARLAPRVREALAGPLRRVIVGIGAFELGNIAATLLILRATELLTPGSDLDGATERALLLYTAYNVAAALGSPVAGRAVDRAGGLTVMLVGPVLFAAAYIGLAVADASVVFLGGCFIVAGLGIACAETAEHAIVATFARRDVRGSAFGLVAAIQSFGNLAASGVAGILWTVVSPRAAFVYAAAWMGIAAVALMVARPKPPTSVRTPTF